MTPDLPSQPSNRSDRSRSNRTEHTVRAPRHAAALEAFLYEVTSAGQPAVEIDDDAVFASAHEQLEAARSRARASRASQTDRLRIANVRPLPLRGRPSVPPAAAPSIVVGPGSSDASVVDPIERGVAWGVGRETVAAIQARRAVDALAAEARESTAELGAAMHGADPKLASLAGTHLRALTGRLLGQLAEAPEPVVRTGVHLLTDRCDQWLKAKRQAAVRLPRRWWGWAPAISALAGPLTFVPVAVCLLRGHPAWALGVFLGLRVMTLMLPAPYACDELDGSERKFSWRLCIYGHFSDAMGLVALGGCLSARGAMGWGTAVSAAAAAMLCGTIVRLAALQGGDFVRRNRLERVARDGSMVAALAATAVVSSAGVARVPGLGVPTLALAAVGPVIYALAEALQVAWRERSNETRRQMLPPELRLADLHLELTPAIEEPRFRPRHAAR